jgi:hypothetical protein
MRLAEYIAEHAKQFVAAGQNLAEIREVIDKRAKAQFWNLDFDGQINVLKDVLSKSATLQVELADALSWTQPVGE